ncbi:hypothetical protein HDV06_006767 [Boothiomyces sp. JEL0866]|nr:hypothetical protein HDV06_006767 [Boothiomyces sp. JEL0866]
MAVEYIERLKEINSNLLVLFHGFGDTHHNFIKFGEKLQLPQTSLMAIKGPNAIPFFPGSSWYEMYDEYGNDLPVETQLKLMKQTTSTILPLLKKQDYKQIILLGFGQGGTIALDIANELKLKAISISGFPLQKYTLSNVLITCSMSQTGIEIGQVKRFVKDDFEMPKQKEAQVIMQWFSEHLYLRNLKLEQMADPISIFGQCNLMNLEEQLLQKEADLKTACELGLYLTQQNQELQSQLDKEKNNQLVIEQEYIKMETELTQCKAELNQLRETSKKQKAIIDKNQDILIQMEIENKDFMTKLNQSEEKIQELKLQIVDLESKNKELINEMKMLEIEIDKLKQIKTKEQIKIETVEIIKHVDNREEINALLDTIEEYKMLYEEAINSKPIEQEQRLITSNLPQQSLFSQLQVKKERKPVELKIDLDLVSQLKSEIQELNQKIEILEKMNSYGLANNNEDEIKYLRMCKVEENNRNIELLKQIKVLNDEVNELKKEKEKAEQIIEQDIPEEEVVKENKQEKINELVKQINCEKNEPASENIIVEKRKVDQEKPEKKKLKINRQNQQECNQQ